MDLVRRTVVAILSCCLLFGSVSPAAAAVEDATSIEEMLRQFDYNGESHASILRLYQAIFDREPDLEGAKYWIDINNQGFSDLDIAGFMSVSDEWASNYEGTTNAEFVEKVYSNVLGRDFDQDGFDYWLGLVDSGQLTRPGMVFYVTANPEFTNEYPFEPIRPKLFADIAQQFLQSMKTPKLKWVAESTTNLFGEVMVFDYEAEMRPQADQLIQTLGTTEYSVVEAANYGDGSTGEDACSLPGDITIVCGMVLSAGTGSQSITVEVAIRTEGVVGFDVIE